MIAQRKFEEKNPFYKEKKIMIKLLKTIFKIAANAVKTPWQNCQSNEKKLKSVGLFVSQLNFQENLYKCG